MLQQTLDLVEFVPYELVPHVPNFYFRYKRLYVSGSENIGFPFYIFFCSLSRGQTLKETTHTKGIASFRSRDGSIKVTYQRIYNTGWMDKDKPIHDIPDIVIEFNNTKTVILDAKNSILDPGKPYPYLRQMDSYIRSSGIEKTDFGIIIFAPLTEVVEHSVPS